VLILNAILILCTLALVAVAVACWRHIRRHLRTAHAEGEVAPQAAMPEVEEQRDANDHN
jgi:hypothetical protein